MPVITRKVPVLVTPWQENDLYGAPQPGASYKELCAVVEMADNAKKSSVRTDSTGTRGHADENELKAVLLFSKATKVKMGDMLTIGGINMRVTGYWPRYDVMSKIDHIQISASFE